MSGIPVFSAGTSLQSSGVSVSAQIPADSAGMLPLFVRVTATAAGYFRLGQDGAPAAVGDLLIQPGDGLILKTCGLSQFSFVSQSGASTVTVTPIDVGGIKYPFTPAALFTTGVSGAWYYPSDFSTLFQDAAGTTPVTAVGQPVGLMKDKSGRGNHAFNSSGNSANFPVLSARYNLLTLSEPTAAQYATSNVADTTMAGFASGLFFGDNSVLRYAVTGTPPSSTSVKLSVFVEMTDGGVPVPGGSSSQFDFGLTVANAVIADGYTVELISGTRYRVSVTGTTRAAPATIDVGIYKYTTHSARTFKVSGFDLRVSNDALNQPAYQRVNTATDYDTVGFKPYLKLNGVNQWLQTNSIDFTQYK